MQQEYRDPNVLKTPLLDDQDDLEVAPVAHPVTVVEVARGASVLAASCTMANAAIGSGVLAFPHAYMNAGVGLSLFFTLVVASMMAYTLYVLVFTAQEYKTTTFEDTVRAALGNWSSHFLKVIIFVLTVGATTGFLVLLGDNATSTLQTWVGKYWYTSRELVILVPGTVICLPLSLLTRIELLAWSSILAVMSVIYIVGIVVAETLLRERWTAATNVLTQERGWVNINYEALTCIPICCYALGCHCQSIPLFYSLQERSMYKMKWVIFNTIALAVVLYVTMAVSGFTLFGYDTPDDVLDGFGTRSDVPLQAQCGRIAISMVSFSAYPVQMFPARSIIKSVFYPAAPSPWWFLPVQVVLLWAITMGLALSGVNIGAVFGLIGASVAVLLFLIYPAAMGLRTSLRASWVHFLALWTTMVGGVFIGILGTTITVAGMFHKM